MISLASLPSCGPNSDGSRLKEVDWLIGTVPIRPNMVAGQTVRVSKSDAAGTVVEYNTPAAYPEVKSYYLHELQHDWAFAGETPLKEWGEDLGGRELVFCNRSNPE